MRARPRGPIPGRACRSDGPALHPVLGATTRDYQGDVDAVDRGQAVLLLSKGRHRALGGTRTGPGHRVDASHMQARLHKHHKQSNDRMMTRSSSSKASTALHSRASSSLTSTPRGVPRGPCDGHGSRLTAHALTCNRLRGLGGTAGGMRGDMHGGWRCMAVHGPHVGAWSDRRGQMEGGADKTALCKCP
jgi:hypothetical protein